VPLANTGHATVSYDAGAAGQLYRLLPTPEPEDQ